MKVRHIALPNLILDDDAVPELIQSEVTAPRISAALAALSSGPARTRALKGYARLRKLLEPYRAAAAAAQLIVADAATANAERERTT